MPCFTFACHGKQAKAFYLGVVAERGADFPSHHQADVTSGGLAAQAQAACPAELGESGMQGLTLVPTAPPMHLTLSGVLGGGGDLLSCEAPAWLPDSYAPSCGACHAPFMSVICHHLLPVLTSLLHSSLSQLLIPAEARGMASGFVTGPGFFKKEVKRVSAQLCILRKRLPFMLMLHAHGGRCTTNPTLARPLHFGGFKL